VVAGVAATIDGHRKEFLLVSADRPEYRPLQQGRRFIDVHRKQPLDNHGPEKMR
jgi:hypothetical protein